MKKGGKAARTPKLRFPEFLGAEGWEETPLKQVLREHGLRSNGKCEVHSVSVHNGVVNQKEHLGRSFAAADTSHYNLAKPHDVIYTKSPTGEFPFGVVKYNQLGYDVIVSPLYGVFSPETPWVGHILDAYFQSPTRANNYLAPIAQKGAKNTIQITNQTFVSKGIHLPRDLAEQQKISDCLKSLDDLIAVQRQKVEILRIHKKGMVQRLFPREGETQPRLRFPEFRDDEGWKETPLKKVLTEHGLRSNGKCEVHSVSVHKGIINQKEHLGRSFAAADTSHYNLARPYDVIYTKSPTGEFPFGVVKYNQLDHNVIVSPLYGVFSPETQWMGYILDAYFESPTRANNYLAPIAQKGAKNTIQITNQIFISKGLHLPRNAEEQQKIAACLSSLDDLITAQTQKLESLKTHKKGLMQQLFPSPEKGEE